MDILWSLIMVTARWTIVTRPRLLYKVVRRIYLFAFRRQELLYIIYWLCSYIIMVLEISLFRSHTNSTWSWEHSPYFRLDQGFEYAGGQIGMEVRTTVVAATAASPSKTYFINLSWYGPQWWVWTDNLPYGTDLMWGHGLGCLKMVWVFFFWQFVVLKCKI